jgi:adenine-specific DNA-methyltransferase
VIIEGDNLEILKVLQKAYLGKVKMIYIDPPYNTGNDFVYPDNYAESLKTYLQYTGQVDGEGKRFSTNTESSGRFHSKWMNMMYPRLSLARNLLSEDGVIFVSIDDNEVQNRKKPRATHSAPLGAGTTRKKELSYAILQCFINFEISSAIHPLM